MLSLNILNYLSFDIDMVKNRFENIYIIMMPMKLNNKTKKNNYKIIPCRHLFNISIMVLMLMIIKIGN